MARRELPALRLSVSRAPPQSLRLVDFKLGHERPYLSEVPGRAIMIMIQQPETRTAARAWPYCQESLT